MTIQSQTTTPAENAEPNMETGRAPYEAPRIQRKVSVRKVTLFSGDSSSITGGG